MDFAKFPFDTQTCPIAIGGLGVRSSEVEFLLDAAENQIISEYEIKTEILPEENLETSTELVSQEWDLDWWTGNGTYQ